MALDFDFTQIDDWETLHEDNFQKTLSEGLVWSCLYIDLHGITATNWQEFYTRIFVWQNVHSAILSYQSIEDGSQVPYYITPDDVFTRVGLRTNVQDKPESYFQDKIWNGLMGRAIHEITKETDDGR